ncbi:type I-C CRISPR-associated protein Cas5c [Colibacter massiliensis]|uniref:type I-C CRISPR-associated protein Cas5c n=1 Tax=Colibacter massiliensis TaxID=1852379 RepID=UPI003F90E803
MSIKVEVWGEYALFSRPEMKVERVSYDVMTPSAARGIMDAIYWHPGMRWGIDKIYVMSPIAFTNIRRNEVSAKINVKSVIDKPIGELYINTKDTIQQRAAMVLKNVHYVIEAHFEMSDKANASDNPGKFQDIVRRRLRRGQCFHTPYFGCREFPVKFREYEFNSVPTVYGNEEKDLGYMLYDMDYSEKENILPIFFRAKLKNGILDLQDREVHS